MNRPAIADHRALRFLTAGSVDDGKSTLIGRLLYDSRAILADQLDTLEKKAAGSAIDLSLLTDGLEAEREQGITIDVAYRYFATRQRKFIIADAPGHEQYTRNMVTAAAGSDAALVLVDITKLDLAASPVPLLAQTRRHAILAHLLRVPNIVFAVNKIDAVDDVRFAFEAVRDALLAFARDAGIGPAEVIPVSALRGDNVTSRLGADWYAGPSLLELLERLPIAQERRDGDLLLPVQYVAREGTTPGEGTGHRPRTLWGRIAHGRVKAGDSVQVYPGGEEAQVVEVRRAGDAVDFAEAGQSAGLVLDRQIDVSRGDWIATPRSVRARRSSRPRSPGSIPSRRRSAESTGCATATAGCRPASRASTTASTSARSRRPTRTNWQSTRSDTCRCRRSSRCLSSPSKSTGSEARSSSSTQAACAQAGPCSSGSPPPWGPRISTSILKRQFAAGAPEPATPAATSCS